MTSGIALMLSIFLTIAFFGLVILTIWYLIEFRPERVSDYNNVISGTDFTVEVKYNPTIRKYFIELKRNGYGRVHTSHIMTRLKCIKYYKDKNIATVEAERFKGNF